MPIPADEYFEVLGPVYATRVRSDDSTQRKHETFLRDIPQRPNPHL